jgi:hypothetical protein
MKCNYEISFTENCSEEGVVFYIWTDSFGLHSNVKVYSRCERHNTHDMESLPTITKVTYEELLVYEILES